MNADLRMKNVFIKNKYLRFKSGFRAFCFPVIAALCLAGAATMSFASNGDPISIDMSRGPVEVIFSADPPEVELERDILLTIKITASSEIDIILPDLGDRLQGFQLSGMFDTDPSVNEGKITLERHARLTPVLANEYRIAPMPITYIDRSRSPAKKEWFPTQPVVFELSPPYNGETGENIDIAMKPVWIHPSLKTFVLLFIALIIMAFLIILLRKGLKKVHENIKLLRMSPKERALRELEMLLDKNLIAKNQVKEFYLELTMVVRRYIERQHKVRAPEQTTEEFLTAISEDPRFGELVVEKLKTFLEAADLVKFAAYRPEDNVAEKASDTAKEYIVSDDKEKTTNHQEQKTKNQELRTKN